MLGKGAKKERTMTGPLGVILFVVVTSVVLAAVATMFRRPPRKPEQ
jgi:hypothetical protein